MARGAIVADGPPTAIETRVGQRTIRATLARPHSDGLASLPGVASVDQRNDTVTLLCTDSDRALRALVDRFPDARDIEVRGAGLDEAFLELTGDHGADTPDTGPRHQRS
jgi:ABC-2 type transport system ATP-binding protein